MTTNTIRFQPDEYILQALMGLLQEAAQEETEILLMDGQTPFARLVTLERQGLPQAGAAPVARVAGLHRGTSWVSPEFDAPLSDELGFDD